MRNWTPERFYNLFNVTPVISIEARIWMQVVGSRAGTFNIVFSSGSYSYIMYVFHLIVTIYYLQREILFYKSSLHLLDNLPQSLEDYRSSLYIWMITWLIIWFLHVQQPEVYPTDTHWEKTAARSAAVHSKQTSTFKVSTLLVLLLALLAFLY